MNHLFWLIVIILIELFFMTPSFYWLFGMTLLLWLIVCHDLIMYKWLFGWVINRHVFPVTHWTGFRSDCLKLGCMIEKLSGEQMYFLTLFFLNECLSWPYHAWVIVWHDPITHEIFFPPWPYIAWVIFKWPYYARVIVWHGPITHEWFLHNPITHEWFFIWPHHFPNKSPSQSLFNVWVYDLRPCFRRLFLLRWCLARPHGCTWVIVWRMLRVYLHRNIDIRSLWGSAFSIIPRRVQENGFIFSMAYCSSLLLFSYKDTA